MMAQKRSPVVLERSYRCRPDRVWDLWVTRDGFASWWGPQGFRVEVHALEARLDGKLHYDMIASSPEAIALAREEGIALSHTVQARFTKLEPKTKLEITNVIDFLPGVKPYESTVHVELVPGNGTTRMIITLSPMHDETTDRMQTSGFESQLSKLDALLGR